MSLTAEQRSARARLAATRRHHPDNPELAAAHQAAVDDATISRHVDAIEAIVRKAPAMTPEQAAKIGRLFTYIDPDAER